MPREKKAKIGEVIAEHDGDVGVNVGVNVGDGDFSLVPR